MSGIMYLDRCTDVYDELHGPIDLSGCTFEHGYMCYGCNEEYRTDKCKSNQLKEKNQAPINNLTIAVSYSGFHVMSDLCVKIR